jgi:hypothetical protein
MSLDNIQLPVIVLQALFKNSLVSLNSDAVNTTSLQNTNISFLGNNAKQITIVVYCDTAIYLPDEELNFLIGILQACKLTMADVALVNIAKSNTINYTSVAEELNAHTMLLLGVDIAQLQLPLQFPVYQIQKFNNQVYLAAPSLQIIAADKAEKTKLWNCLKTIFTIG